MNILLPADGLPSNNQNSGNPLVACNDPAAEGLVILGKDGRLYRQMHAVRMARIQIGSLLNPVPRHTGVLERIDGKELEALPILSEKDFKVQIGRPVRDEFIQGFCYLHIIDDEEKQEVATYLRKFPSLKQVIEIARVERNPNQYCVTFGRYANGTKVIHLMAVDCGLTAMETMEFLRPYSEDFSWRIGGEAVEDVPFEKLSVENVHVNPIHAVTVSPVVNQRFFATHESYFMQQYLEYDGYCYLNLFVPSFRMAAFEQLGGEPHIRELFAVLENNPTKTNLFRFAVTVTRFHNKTNDVLVHIGRSVRGLRAPTIDPADYITSIMHVLGQLLEPMEMKNVTVGGERKPAVATKLDFKKKKSEFANSGVTQATIDRKKSRMFGKVIHKKMERRACGDCGQFGLTNTASSAGQTRLYVWPATGEWLCKRCTVGRQDMIAQQQLDAEEIFYADCYLGCGKRQQCAWDYDDDWWCGECDEEEELSQDVVASEAEKLMVEEQRIIGPTIPIFMHDEEPVMGADLKPVSTILLEFGDSPFVRPIKEHQTITLANSSAEFLPLAVPLMKYCRYPGEWDDELEKEVIPHDFAEYWVDLDSPVILPSPRDLVVERWKAASDRTFRKFATTISSMQLRAKQDRILKAQREAARMVTHFSMIDGNYFRHLTDCSIGSVSFGEPPGGAHCNLRWHRDRKRRNVLHHAWGRKKKQERERTPFERDPELLRRLHQLLWRLQSERLPLAQRRNFLFNKGVFSNIAGIDAVNAEKLNQKQHSLNGNIEHANIHPASLGSCPDNCVSKLQLQGVPPQIANQVLGQVIHVFKTGWFHRQLGFTVRFQVGGLMIFSRNKTFSRDKDDDKESFLTVMQDKRFWSSDKLYSLTVNGMARVWKEKKNDFNLRGYMAKQFGMSFSKAEEYFRSIPTEPRHPDVRLVDDDEMFEGRIKPDVRPPATPKDNLTYVPELPSSLEPKRARLVEPVTMPKLQGRPLPPLPAESPWKPVWPDNFMFGDLSPAAESKKNPLSSIAAIKGDLQRIRSNLRLRTNLVPRVPHDSKGKGPPNQSYYVANPQQGPTPADEFKIARNSTQADIEQNPGPVLPKIFRRQNRPTSMLVSNLVIDDEGLTMTEFLKVNPTDEERFVINAVLSEWFKIRNFEPLVLYHVENFTVRAISEKYDVGHSLIPQEATFLSRMVAKSTMMANNAYQDYIDSIPTHVDLSVSAGLPEHVAVKVERYLNSVYLPIGKDSVLFAAFLWKRFFGCPAKANVSVQANTLMNKWIITTEIAPVTKGKGQLSWFLDDEMLCHCGNKNEEPERNEFRNLAVEAPTHTRSRSLGTLGHRRIEPGTRLSVIMGEDLHLRDKYQGAPAFDFLKRMAVLGMHTVEEVVGWFSQNCDIITNPPGTQAVTVHEFGPEMNFLADQCLMASSSARRAQAKINATNEWHVTAPANDNRSPTDIMNTVAAALRYANKRVELCSVLALATAWKYRWGCPGNGVVVAVSANSRRNSFDVIWWREPTPRSGPGRICWFLDDIMVVHCGHEPPVYPGNKISQKAFDRINFSPYKENVPAPRSDATHNGTISTGLRHHRQNAGIRLIKNPLLHGLPGNIWEVAATKTPWEETLERFTKRCVCHINDWIIVNGHRNIVSTANKDFKFKYPTINFVSSGYEAFVEEGEDLIIHTKLNGYALRNYRMLPAIYTLEPVRVLVANGKSADWQQFEMLDPEDDSIPLPKCNLFFVHPLAVNNYWCETGYLSSELNQRFWYSTMTIYGGDEMIALSRPCNTMISKPLFGMGRPWFTVPLANQQPCSINYYDQTKTFRFSKETFSHEVADEIYRRWFPGRKECASRPNLFTRDIAWKDMDKTAVMETTRSKLANKVTSHVSPCNNCGDMIPAVYCGVRPKDLSVARSGMPLPLAMQLYFIFKLVMWLYFKFVYYRSLLSPVLLEFHPLMTESEHQYPDDFDDPLAGKRLLIPAMGTHGDIQPMKYYANLAASLGVPTHMYKTHVTNTKQLEALKNGDFMGLLPGYMELATAGSLGYHAVLQPHVDVAEGRGETYSLSPPKKYISPVRYTRDFRSIPLLNQIVTFFAELMGDIFEPGFHIGALQGCDLPRSANGLRPVAKVTNLGTFEHGWCSGSASIEVIPEWVRKQYPRIPDGDHNEIFRRYKNIHMHGGAGTVQTALACGAKPIVWDPSLDRNYKFQLEPKHFRQPSVMKFYGWLWCQGFSPEVPLLVLIPSIALYLFKMRYRALYKIFFFFLHLYAICVGFWHHHVLLILLLTVVPTVMWKILRRYNLFATFKWCFQVAWEYPYILCLGVHQSVVILLLYSISWWRRFLQDVNSVFVRETELIYEPVTRGGFKFKFPFGHYAIRDVYTGDTYEGRFVETGKTGLGDPFRLVKTNRWVAKNAKIFPIPVGMATLRSHLARAQTMPYSGSHNCTTIVFNLVWRRGIIWPAFMFMVTSLTASALGPSTTYKRVFSKLYPDYELENTEFYRSLGFAAGDNDLPIEPDISLEATEEGTNKLQPEELNTRDLFDHLLNEIAAINSVMNQAFGDEAAATFEEAAIATLDHELEKFEIPEEEMVKIEPLPLYVLSTYGQIIDEIHEALKWFGNQRLVNQFVAWLRGAILAIADYLKPIMEMLSWFLTQAYHMSSDLFQALFRAISKLIDKVWGPENSQRVKTVWGLTGITKNSMLSAKLRMAYSIQTSKFKGRGDFIDDWEEFVGKGKEYAQRLGARGAENIGGSQRRPVKLGKPVMSTSEADVLGFTEDMYCKVDSYEDRIKSYLERGVPQASDGVLYGALNPDRIADSINRYEPSPNKLLNSEERAFAVEISDAMASHNPEVYLDAEVLPLQSTYKYVKPKYSPGAPFINDKSFKSRQAMFDAGFDRVLMTKAKDMLEKGEYPTQFYHAFVKSQAIDIVKCLPEEQGGKLKDLRTVVSQDLWSYFLDQCVQLERNKRNTWQTFGAGMGMPLNQSMGFIFEQMSKVHKEEGGRYIIADAKAYDSGVAPFLFEVAANLASLGFKNHPSGNGSNIASVLKAKYDAMQDAWVFGVTEPTYDSITIAADEQTAYDAIIDAKIKKLVPLDELIDHAVFDKLSEENKIAYVRNIKPPTGMMLLTKNTKWVPKASGWMGNFVIDEAGFREENIVNRQTFTYLPGSLKCLIADVQALSRSSYTMLSNVHFKNRGGGTGQSATSWDNTVTFKAGVIAAWSKTTGRPPKEFYDYNILYNTGDDTIWHTHGKFGLGTVKDVYAFKQACIAYGIQLEIETTEKITETEYLSKFVRTPTKEDSAALQSWRHWKIQNLARANKIDPNDKDAIARYNNPQFVVVQNANAIDMRRTAFRYYQGSQAKYLYTLVERGAGHAQVTAFSVPLYQRFAAEWCEDVNTLMKQHKIDQVYRLNHDKYGLPQVIQSNPRWKKSFSPRQEAFLRWMKGNMFPSYLKVVDTHMNIKLADPTAHQRFLHKLEKGWRGWDQILREQVDALFNITDAIPDSWSKKFQPGIDMIYPEEPFHTYNHYVEKFLMVRLLQEYSVDEIEYSMFSQRVMESPYAAICETSYFWERWQDPDYRQRIIDEPAMTWQAMTLLVSIIYATTHFIEKFVDTLWFVGAAYRLFMWTFIGINKVYGLSNTLWWHITGKSSKTISMLLPKDPYIVSKRISGFIVDWLPHHVGYLLFPILILINELPNAIDAAIRLYKKGNSISKNQAFIPMVNNPWSAYAAEYVENLRAQDRPRAYVSAPTGTGKSTWFPAAIWSQRAHLNLGKIWIVSPRKILRDEWEIPFDIPVQKLKAQVKRSTKADIYCATYGHFLSRIDDVDKEHDLVFFDEFHELSGEMLLAESIYKGPIFLMSATPVNIPALQGTPTYLPGMKPRFKTTIYHMDGKSTIDMFMDAKEFWPDQCKRAMIVVPTLREVDKIMSSLTYAKIECHEVSSRSRKISETGVLVCTPYVQTGLDIPNPPLILIDSGKDFVINKGARVLPFPWTDKDTCAQRWGRVARKCDGIVVAPTNAGKGQTPVRYPSGQLFQHKIVAEHFKLPQLTPVRNPVDNSAPFMGVNTNVLQSKSAQKSVAIIHCLALVGVRFDELKRYYNRVREGFSLGEDYWWINRIMESDTYKKVKLDDWELAVTHASRTDSVYYGMNGDVSFKRPIYPVNSAWQEQFTEQVLDEGDEIPEIENSLRLRVEKVKQRTGTIRSILETIIKQNNDNLDGGQLLDKIMASLDI
ncbi:polyprotein [Botrytis cinerea hypovirus 2]|uniref:Polyprotein n=1 Tax=Botrytis cinerea hypovirus 2 TaxID=2735925 RepID=A0ABX6NZ97_9VIRU|nr:polyprotein [Botrytis cinerea hypovirus 2]QJT73706.1 polyprotein [Botrytis cinerea hypovirus 2]